MGKGGQVQHKESLSTGANEGLADILLKKRQIPSEEGNGLGPEKIPLGRAEADTQKEPANCSGVA